MHTYVIITVLLARNFYVGISKDIDHFLFTKLLLHVLHEALVGITLLSNTISYR